MSPHSVDGAVGGRRIRSVVGPYDSSDDEQKNASGRSGLNLTSYYFAFSSFYDTWSFDVIPNYSIALT